MHLPISRRTALRSAAMTLAGWQAASLAETPWRDLWDGTTLTGWKETAFGGSGGVVVAEGRIILEAGNDLTGVTLASEPPRTDYELEFEACRLSGSDFFCGLTFPVGAECVTLVLGGWGGATVGISSIDGNDASENETTTFRKFEDGRWYRVRVRVTAEKLEAFLDQERLASVELASVKLGMRAGEIELSQPLGIASFRTRAGLRGLRLRTPVA